ncbi:hypothetical protein HOLleu_03461 [Holothuria leucospilota]|uniref:Uncharacterized protein n=1 Tax=Holothuria leucospilota TaxID=206669 RepID=A0A9Q1HLX0_HOLLE|nr:hypothetical protein HOLleu_03461 [Holothuria leucospilota]
MEQLYFAETFRRHWLNSALHWLNSALFRYRPSAPFAEKLGIDPKHDFERLHRVRRPSRRIDDHPDTASGLTLHQFYRKECRCVLDTLITQLKDKMQPTLDIIKPLEQVLGIPFKLPKPEEVACLAALFPCEVNADVLTVELELFKGLLENAAVTNSVSEAARLAHQHRRTLPLTWKAYQLLLTAPITVAKDERTFSHLKFVKSVSVCFIFLPSKWPPADGFLFGEDIDLPYETEYNSALYYESFQDGSFDEEEEDDDEDLNSFFPPASSVNFSSVSSESSESEFEIPDQGAPPEDICGSAGSDYLRNTYISSLPELSLDAVILNRSNFARFGHKDRNDMSTSQKQSMVESLLMRMTSSLGPREKLEVSRILDTDGDISSVSYELSIDAENLSEEKLARIQDLIEESMEDSSPCKKREFKQGRSKIENDVENKSVYERSKSQKKFQSTDRSNHSRVSKERQRKECKQNIKEKRSGLFQQEEVISLYCDGSSDEEIDILE